MNIYKEFEEYRQKFEEMTSLKKITTLIIIMIITIVITRLFAILVHSPNPTLFGFEFHHFDYGLALLIWTSILIIFGQKKHISHLVLHGVTFGLILDYIWFIRSNIIDPSTNEILIYHSTLPSAIFLTGIVFLVAISIWHILGKPK